LEIGNLIAIGGTSEVFEYGDKIIKLYFDNYLKENVKHEYQKTMSAFSLGLPVPKIYDMIQVNGRYGLVFERINGCTLNDKLFKQCAYNFKNDIVDKKILEAVIECIKATAYVLAEVHKIKASFPNTAEDALLYSAIHNNYLNENEKEQIVKIIHTLPKGDTVCHGDPNPNNIMVAGNKYLLIDWVDCVTGDPAYDVAEVIIMYRYNNIRHESKTKTDFYVLSIIDLAIETFINEYQRITKTDMTNIDKWILPKLTTQLTGSNSDEYKIKISKEIRRLLNLNSSN